MDKILVNHVALFRKHHSFTQTELARLCGCSKNTISSIECYLFEPTIKLALKLCIVFKCRVEDLFEYIDR